MNNRNPTVKEYCIQQGFSERVTEDGVPYLIERWERTAERVADYRGWYGENYRNDLSVRQILSELAPIIPENERNDFQRRLAIADAQFMVNSINSDACIYGIKTETKYGYTRQQNWWYYRMPKIIGSDF